ncbi:energy transducer TonB [Prevotella corporis]|uniref:energy transducer TonB n=1 Tax=Prevotella corporis TaxID=28128 RepID=UPI002366DB93|nr:TonB family protein [Prevotella corporis]
MTRGRNICNILKAIRKQIADANEIKYSPEECHFKGECKGTCPKCEQDVKDLEYELRLRQMAGKAIKVAGIALGITTLATSTTSCATQKAKYDMESSMPEKVIPISYQDYTSNDTILLKEKEELGKKGVLFVQGHVIDDEKNPIFGAIITSKLSGKQTLSDIDGNFTLEVKQGDMITVKYIGFQDRVIKLSEMSQDKLNIVTLTAHILGEVIAGIVPYPPKTTPVIKKDKTKGKSSKQNKTVIVQPAIRIDSTESKNIFGVAEETASFPGGSVALMQYIAQNLRYPNIQGDCNIQGRVIVGFTINEDGILSDIKVMKSISPAFDEEAIRVVKSMPKWKPAKLNGKAVKSKYTIPVNFRIE